MKKYIIPVNVVDFDEFVSSVNIPAYAEIHRHTSMLYDDDAIAVPEDKLLDMLNVLRSEGVRCLVEPTYRVYEAGEDFTTSTSVYETDSLDNLQDWFADSDGEYVVFKNREEYNG